MSEINWKQVLLDAADLIDRMGWVQHQAYRKPFLGLFGGGYCIIGALNEVAGAESIWSSPALDVLRNLTNGTPIDWNDDYCTSKAQAVDKLREAANDPSLQNI
jgi:hypothetical protein